MHPLIFTDCGTLQTLRVLAVRSSHSATQSCAVCSQNFGTVKNSASQQLRRYFCRPSDSFQILSPRFSTFGIGSPFISTGAWACPAGDATKRLGVLDDLSTWRVRKRT